MGVKGRAEDQGLSLNEFADERSCRGAAGN
jgi:hypothetical protein